ncbi:hypothetical protein [Defluviimonas salinarum]|uniref:Uncharacterized protein n=1 Tax=Defluviimonas salinarum TaxID=2992147 RepID=A0ABT3J900_9RHOB|nr:hypothetical protein [Defluviimonas salinarum]MCW3783910.1 hypothetical protein [Defluviimonas salinarum]
MGDTVVCFSDTSNWKEKNATTLIYAYDFEGKHREGEIEKEPHTLHVSLESLSLVETTSWVFKDDNEPDSKTGYVLTEHFRGYGLLQGSCLHAFAVGEKKNETFDAIEIRIYPADKESLIKASHFDRWSFILSKEQRPTEGWLQDEMGRIEYYSANEYMEKSSVMARLFLDRSSFDALALRVRACGRLASSHLVIFADLYQFAYEAAFADFDETRNYGMLCTDERSGRTGFAKARLDEMRLDWSALAPDRRGSDQVEVGAGDTLDADLRGERAGALSVTDRIAGDVRRMRERMDTLYLGAFLLVTLLAGFGVLNLMGF